MGRFHIPLVVLSSFYTTRQAEDRRNRGTEGLRPSSNGGDDGGGAPKGEPFQLSNRRDGGGLGVQQGACCQ